MLVLSRKPGEKLQIGNNITITILEVRGRVMRIGIDAPNEVRVVRGELKCSKESRAVDHEPAPSAVAV